MFVRRKHNKSGSASIQVIAKVDGKYRVQKSFGSSRDEATLASLERNARQWADEHEFGEELFTSDDAAGYDAIMACIEQAFCLFYDNLPTDSPACLISGSSLFFRCGG